MDINTFLTVTHDFGRGIEIGSYTLRIYQLMFLAAFVSGFYIMKNIFKRENQPEEWLDSLLIYVVISTIIGARLGHVFFYQWDYYSQNPSEILMVWKGGLASHGAAIAIIIGLIIYSKKVTKKSVLWILDRVVITIALAAAFIRIGNYTNSEIYGQIENSAFETVFLYPEIEYLQSRYQSFIHDVSFESTDKAEMNDEFAMPVYIMTVQLNEGVDAQQAAFKLENEVLPGLSYRDEDRINIVAKPNAKSEVVSPEVLKVEVFGIPRYPTQLFEALGYFISFLILIFFYFKTNNGNKQGFLFGLFLILIFGFRLFIEYIKEDQVSFESGMALNMGQWLSIPLVIAGLYFMITSKNRLNTQVK